MSHAANVLSVVAALSSGPVSGVAEDMRHMLVSPLSHGYVRPTSSSLQSVSSIQTRILVPGADDMLVAHESFIRPHLARACELASPFVGHLREARPDLVGAVDHVCSFAHDPGGFGRDQAARLEALDGFAGRLVGVAARVAAGQSAGSSALMVASATAIPLFEAAILAMGWPDASFSVSRALGFHTVGPYPDSCVFRQCKRPATRCYTSLDSALHNQRVLDRCGARWRSASDSERAMLREVSRKTHSERAKGIAFGGYTIDEVDEILGHGCWHALDSFGVEQGVDDDGRPKVRRCDNGRSSHTNECFSSLETISCESASFPTLVASLFAERWPGPLPDLHHSTDDVELAYRRMAAFDPGTTVVCLYDTVAGGPRFFLMHGHNFGLASAVLSFNRHSQLVAAVCRRLFGIPCCAYFDDYDVCAPSWAAPLCKHTLRRVHAMFGMPLSEGLNGRGAASLHCPPRRAYRPDARC